MKKVTLENYGIPATGMSDGHGHHYAEICVMTPQNLTPEMKKIVEDLHQLGIRKGVEINTYDPSAPFYDDNKPFEPVSKESAFAQGKNLYNTFYSQDSSKSTQP
jgi:DnaJ-class molecular chaperone